jgi:glycosyltransferase involved in cell wall biosynthesis
MPLPLPLPLRVAFIDHAARISGAEIELVRLVEAAEDIEATVLLAEHGPLEARLFAVGASVEVLSLNERTRAMKRRDVRAGTGLAHAAVDVANYGRRLSRRLRELSPDVVSLVSLKAGIYGSLAARLAGIPAVWHLHDQISSDHISSQAVLPLRLFIATVPTAVVAPARAPLAAIGRMRPGMRTAVIPVPVPLPPRPVEISPAVRRVGMVGRLAPWKGQHVFLRAFAEAFPSGTTTASIVGAAMFGEHAYAEELRTLAEQLGIAERVEFRGFRNDVQAELERLDLFVHASTATEPFGAAVFEGMAAGLPVVAARGGGPSEYIRHGEHGLLHTPGDVEGLAAAMRLVAGDQRMRLRLADAGRRRVAQFSPEVVAAAWTHFYRELVAERRSRSRQVDR